MNNMDEREHVFAIALAVLLALLFFTIVGRGLIVLFGGGA